MATPVETAWILAAAARLRELAKTDIISMEDFLLECQRGDRFDDLLMLVVNLRANRRTRMKWSRLRQELRGGQLSEAARRISFSALQILRAVRAEVFPFRSREFGGFVQQQLMLPLRAVRQLRLLGIGLSETNFRDTLREQAAVAFNAVTSAIAADGALVWFDNFFRPHYSSNPAQGDVSLNSTVVAVLPTASLLGDCPHVLSLDWMVGRLEMVCDRTRAGLPELRHIFDAIQMSALTAADIRVPLDEPRRSVTSLPWTPLVLSDQSVSSNLGLLLLLELCGVVCSQTRKKVVPLLVDVNIHYRIMKMACGRTMAEWDVPALLRCMPPVFGLWHAYKYVVVVVVRLHHSVLWFLVHGSLREGDKCPTSPGLRAYELIIAALLLAPMELRQGWRALVSAAWIDYDRDMRHYQVVAAYSGEMREARSLPKTSLPVPHM